jgi:hypothetical protein
MVGPLCGPVAFPKPFVVPHCVRVLTFPARAVLHRGHLRNRQQEILDKKCTFQWI